MESGKKIILTTPTETSSYSAVEDATINDKTLAAYSGVYYSDETETKLTVKSKDGKAFPDKKTAGRISLSHRSTEIGLKAHSATSSLSKGKVAISSNLKFQTADQ
jgi:hypothetical protein